MPLCRVSRERGDAPCSVAGGASVVRGLADAASRAHQLAIADVHLALNQATSSGLVAGLHVEHEPTCWRRYSGPGGARLTLKPDLALEIDVDGQLAVWFIEVDRATESRNRISSKAEQYLAYWRTGTEQARHGTFPKVLWLCPDRARADIITATIDNLGTVAAAMQQAAPVSEVITVLAGARR